ncbi:MAG TPA: DUF4491 domain-containing protein [Lachnoclostridium phytofermentans]|uniref:DUF4491 domain-containing protein n=1 Tax=Lachnoclostridium phytofermentans TaxID=66219 RepID=A0A3D2X7D6_9FIRM|nr:DUF4491 family protein [Lachnoclostridium sp.]HCL03060.1 DUF4491 domain-containing protein [Lachnoclostridium phytofermentans]
MAYTGIIIGFISFIAIALYHPIVIKAEYYFTKNIWPVFAIFGIMMLILSVYATQVIVSAGLAVLGITNLWSIGELVHQEKRVEKGWFPKNPKRK